MGDLYRSDWSPPRTPKHLDRTSLSCSGDGQAGDIMRRKFVPADWGDPVEAVGWFHPGEGDLRIIVADYANGRRAVFKQRARDFVTTFTKVEPPHAN